MPRRCDATTRAGGRCQQPAGWGTDHPGDGRCKLHGGRSTGPIDQRGNKNAVTTGEYETIWLDQLADDEQLLVRKINPDALAQLDDEIRLATIRERRMLARIANLDAAEDGLTTVRISEEHREGVDPGEGDDSGETVFTDKTTSVREGTLGQIQAIEHALTRVQQAKTRMVELRARLATGEGDDDALADLVAVIARSRQEIARRREAVDGDQ